jgi:hypothetical protein
MDCRAIKNYISPYLDDELDPADARMVQSHLAECLICQRDYEELAMLVSAVKQLGSANIPAPVGFKNAVMKQILAETKQVSIFERTNKIVRKWKIAVTATAATLLITLAGLGIHFMPASQVADNNNAKHHTVVVADKGNSAKTTSNHSAESPDVSPTVSPGADTNGDSSPLSPLTESGVLNKGSNSYPVFLNTERVIKTTMLKVQVADSSAALEQALNIAAAAGADTQNLGQQVNENGTCSVLKITAARSAAAGLINSLSNLGTVSGQEIDRKDITSQFSQTLSKYQSLVAEHETARDGDQLAQLEQQINKLQDQLNSLQSSAQKETIILWLEK